MQKHKIQRIAEKNVHNHNVGLVTLPIQVQLLHPCDRTEPDLREGAPQASHQQRVSRQIVRVLFLANDDARETTTFIQLRTPSLPQAKSFPGQMLGGLHSWTRVHTLQPTPTQPKVLGPGLTRPNRPTHGFNTRPILNFSASAPTPRSCFSAT